MSKFNVQGFPTILIFGADKENPVPYEGARTASAIESFALEQLENNVGPPEVAELTSLVCILIPTSSLFKILHLYHLLIFKLLLMPDRMS